jgi:hypothetical protein
LTLRVVDSGGVNNGGYNTFTTNVTIHIAP